MISLTCCKTKEVYINDFTLWGQPICLNNETKKVIDDKNIDYFLLHNRKLKRNCIK